MYSAQFVTRYRFFGNLWRRAALNLCGIQVSRSEVEHPITRTTCVRATTSPISRSSAGAGFTCRPSLDDYSRYIIAWKLCTNMTADDVTATLKLALEASGCNRANVVHKPRLLSDNGSSYISGDLAEWLEDHGMDHVRGAPYHPQTQGKIERWHQTLKNRILLENYYLPGDLENQISAFVDHYNNQRYHESIGNVTPADAYFGRHTAIIEKRKRIKKLTTQNRRLSHQRQAA